MKRVLLAVLYLFLTAVVAKAQIQNPYYVVEDPGGTTGGGNTGTAGNLVNHGGPLMPYAKVVYIFWGSFPSGYAAELQAYRDFWGGMTNHMGMLDQYNTPQSSLTPGYADFFDPISPATTNVTEADIQAEITRVTNGSYDTNAVYTVVLPYGWYFTNVQGFTSCDGPYFRICGYHNAYYPYGGTTVAVKYAVIPYLYCDGCRVYDTNNVEASVSQRAEVFIIHEVREAITNPTGQGWYDGATNEADDKCEMYKGGVAHPENIFHVLTPAGPNDTPYWHPGYNFWFQKEWSNAAKACVQ